MENENALLVKQTIPDMVDRRNELINSFKEFVDVLEQAQEKFSRIKETLMMETGKETPFYSSSKEAQNFWNVLNFSNKDDYLFKARRIVDSSFWSKLFTELNVEKLMDATEKVRFARIMEYVEEKRNIVNGEILNKEEIEENSPEFNIGNAQSTVENIIAQSGDMFLRGIATAFSKLDRCFKSHDGFKLGNRIIIKNIYEWGCYIRPNIKDLFVDIERVFSVLDKKTNAQFDDIITGISKLGVKNNENNEFETDYFRIKIFKNNNAHFWFKRDDLVLKVNKLLATYYGETIGDSRQEEDDPLSEENVKRTPAKNHGYFPTPEKVIDLMFNWTRIRLNLKGRVLEPSAGNGNIASRLVCPDTEVDCVEIQSNLADELKNDKIYNNVWCQDFLTMQPKSEDEKYNLIVMNPPFDCERDVDHVNHALKFLKKGGYLVAIMSAGTEFRNTKKSIAFRKKIMESDEFETNINDLPALSFKESGTNVNTILIDIKRIA